MKTLTRAAERSARRVEPAVCYTCVNPEHHLLAARQRQIRLRDGRWLVPQDLIPEHDYCPTHMAESGPLHVHGRAAFCPLGGTAEDHEWVEAPAPESTRLGTG